MIPARPILLTDMVLEIEDDDFAAALSTCRLEPESQIVRFKGLKKGASSTFPTDPVWTLNLTLADDWDSTDSLSEYLWANAGQKKSAYLRPEDGNGAAFELTLVITPGGAGGNGDQVATSTISLGVDGQPTRIPGTAAAPSLSSISPASGVEAGGELVKILGRRFATATAVDFGAVPATEFRADSDSCIYAIAPAGTGTVAVKVTNTTGESLASLAYVYEE